MVKLPDWTDVGQAPRVDGGRAVGSYDGTAMAKAGVNAGKAVAEIGTGVAEYTLEQNRYEYHQEHAQKLTEKIGLYGELQADTDYSTMSKRYGERIEKITEDAAARISDPVMRERFLTDAKSDNAQFNLNVTEHSRRLEREAINGYRAGVRDRWVDYAVDHPIDEQRGQVLENYNGLVDAAVAKQALTPAQAVAEKRAFAVHYATASVKALVDQDPAEAVRRLEGSRPDRDANLNAANDEMQLTPQERALYQRHLTNLYGSGGVDNKDGSRSTLFNVGTEIDGKHYNVPSVYEGKILPPRAAVDRAIKEGLDKFPSYANQAEAEARYGKLHDYMEKDTEAYLKNKGKPSSIYDIIPAETRLHLLTAARSANVGEQEEIRHLAHEDAKSLLATGQGVEGLSADRIRRAFGGKQGEKAVREWDTARTDAKAIWDSTHDMGTLTEDGINERVEHYRASAEQGGEGFEGRKQIYDEVRKRGEAVLKQRYSDPAAAVGDDPAVKAARAQAVNLDPSTYRPLAKARMEAQAKLAIPEELRTPLTKDEALKLMKPLTRMMIPGKEKDVITDIAEKFDEMFGEHADEAFKYAWQQSGHDKQLTQTAALVIRKLGLGQPIAADEARSADQASEVRAAEGALPMGTRRGVDPDRGSLPASMPRNRGAEAAPAPVEAPQPAPAPAAGAKPAAPGKDQARMPTQEDVIALRRYPKLTERFDAKYGNGAAKKILETYPVGVPGRGPLSNMITGQ